MPTYDYKCKECGHEVRNFFKSITANHPTICPECKNKEGLEQHHFTAEQHVTYQGDHWHEASGKRGKF